MLPYNATDVLRAMRREEFDSISRLIVARDSKREGDGFGPRRALRRARAVIATGLGKARP